MKLYFDTNILRDYLENRNPKSVELVELARQKNADCFTSAFTMMELSDLQKDTLFFQKTVIGKKWDVDRFLRERRKKILSEESYTEVNDYLNATTVRLPFIKFFNLSEDGWKIAQFISSHSNLSATDTLHLATAYSAGSNALVTNDQEFIKFGNEVLQKSKRRDDIVICTPEKVSIP